MNEKLETQAAEVEAETSTINLLDDDQESEQEADSADAQEAYEANQSEDDKSDVMASDEVAEAETNSEAAELRKELENAKKQIEREKSRYGGVKADKVLLARAYKHLKEQYGFTDDEAAEELGIAPNDLRARVEKADAPENEAEAQVKEFNKRYDEYGFKKSLDRRFGTDTMQYVQAFEKAAQADPQLMEAFISCDPDELPDFVVEQGKELAEAVGDFSVSSYKALKTEKEALQKQIDELKAQLASNNTPADEDELPSKDKLPTSARASGVSSNNAGDLMSEVF